MVFCVQNLQSAETVYLHFFPHVNAAFSARFKAMARQAQYMVMPALKTGATYVIIHRETSIDEYRQKLK
ncbi:hypothetical protein CVD19_01680 [Bacillus sp. T33-2]|nr:hypothetical protein CVD19_01680 [Bacillus sp. T33-2]